MKYHNVIRLFLVLMLMVTLSPRSGLAQTTLFNGVTVPGTVIHHSPASSGMYIGSPSLTILRDGTYVASHDTFGPGGLGKTEVYRSVDQGQTWTDASSIIGQYWSGLFVQNNDLYVLGTTKAHGDLVIRKSVNGGFNWTSPTDGSNGQLLAAGAFGYHTSSVPLVVHDGRIWRAYEDNGAGGAGVSKYRTRMMSAPVGSNLLDASNWTHTNFINRVSDWLPDFSFLGWLEGNAVVDRDGNVVNVLRVDVGSGKPEKAAITRVQSNTIHTFDPDNDIIDMLGGAKKFTIRYHKGSDKYWAVTSIVNDDNYDPNRKPSDIRNTMALISSDDLTQWDVEQIVVQDLSDVDNIGFQYMDWQFDGGDIVMASRTAYPDGLGGADNYHNANFLTFHRIVDIVPEPIVGDLDGDWFVGVTDLNIVLSNWNQIAPLDDSRADPSGDGFVGIADLGVILGNWNGGNPPPTDTSSIPEPSTAALMVLYGCVIMCRWP